MRTFKNRNFKCEGESYFCIEDLRETEAIKIDWFFRRGWHRHIVTYPGS